MRIRNNLYMLLCLLVMFLLPTGCSNNAEVLSEMDKDDDKIHLNIGVRLPGVSKADSRGFGEGSTDYYTFSDLYVAVFVEIEGVSYLDEFVKADNSAPTWNSSNQCWDFGVSLTRTTEPRRLHFIANYPNLTMGFGEEGQLIGRLLANGENHDVYWNYRDLARIDEDFNLELQNIPLLRNYVKVVLNDRRTTNKERFVLKGYALYNVPTKGTVAPYNPSGTNRFANFVAADGQCQSYNYLLETEKYEGNEPYDDGKLLSKAINWIEINNGIIPPTFMYERSNRITAHPTFMLIKGQYSAEGNVTSSTPVTYYKLDFVYDDAVSNSKVYYNLLRNFIFTMNLNSVTGAGYNTVEEAITQPASNNIGGDAVAKDYTNISDGTSQLFVSTTYMMLTSNSEAYIYYKYISNIEESLIENQNVVVTAPAGNVLASNAVVSTSNETSGQYAGWRKVTIKPKSVSTVSQSQELIFAADGLQRKVELVLRQPYRLTVETPEEVDAKTKTPLDVTIKLPSGVAESLFPLRLFISSENNTIYPDYGTNMPAEARNGKYGFIREVSWEEYNNSLDKTFVCKFLTNCDNSATTVYVDNEYFSRGNDSFINTKLTKLEILPSDFKCSVTVQKDNNYYPQVLASQPYNTNVSLRYNNQVIADAIKISNNNNNLTVELNKTITLENNNGINGTDVLVLTFSSKYRSKRNSWSNNATTFTAEITIDDLLAGKTLEFTR